MEAKAGLSDVAVTRLLLELPNEWRLRWCTPGELGCACLGCANSSGGLWAKGVTEEQWQRCVAALQQEREQGK